MSDQVQEIDPLSQSAANTNTDFPVLAGDRIYRMEIKSVKKGPSKSDASRDVLSLKLVTTKDGKFSNGKNAKAGWPVYKHIGLSEVAAEGDKNGRTNQDIARDLALLNKAVGKAEKTARDTMNDPSYLEGLLVDCKVGVSKATGTFPESNTISFVLPA